MWYDSAPKKRRYWCNPALSIQGKFSLTSGTSATWGSRVMLKLVCMQWWVSQDQGADWEAEQRTSQRKRGAFCRKNWKNWARAYKCTKFILCRVTSVTLILQLRYSRLQHKPSISVFFFKQADYCNYLPVSWSSECPTYIVQSSPYTILSIYSICYIFPKVCLRVFQNWHFLFHNTRN